ncbi:MAG: hypothetical protein HFI74_03275 [Lachnospiraceae bacterium]|jgi:hypothetical protein|nr:hypothetical protein [Lachnospiraceae bacterium]
MIERKDILSIPYLKKTTFTGSYDGLRFRFAVVKKESEVQEKEQQVLQITAWEGPYGFDATSEEKKQQIETEFSEEGIQNGIDWLNALWEADPEKWKRAKSEW